MSHIIEGELKAEYIKERRLWEKKLTLALDIGEQLALSGAEVSRVEDSVTRIISYFGAKNSSVLSITTSIIVTVNIEEYNSFTQTRRLGSFVYNMDRLGKMNAISRAICEGKLDLDEARREFNEAISEETYPLKYQFGFFMLIAFCFTLFFGGSFRDAIISTLIAILFKYIEIAGNKIAINKFLTILISSLLGGFLAIVAVKVGLADSVSKISIGDVMLLIPGIALTNSIRDMFSGDTITGGVKFFEASLTAVMIAFGFVLASEFYNSLFLSDVVSTTRNPNTFIGVTIELLASFFGAIGYAGIFNVRKHKIFFAGLGGLIGWSVYVWLDFFSLSAPVKYFFAAIVVNFYAEKMAIREKVPATVFLVSAIMPLVPGGLLYEIMKLAVKNRWEEFGPMGIETLSLALALAFGILVASSIIKSTKIIKKTLSRRN